MTTRFSLAGLMGFVLLAALGFAGLKAANEGWASLCFTLLAVALAISPLTAWQGRGKSRAYWGGFAVAAWAYFALTFGGMGTSPLTAPPLATGAVFDRVEPMIHPNLSVYSLGYLRAAVTTAVAKATMPGPVPPPVKVAYAPEPSASPFGPPPPHMIHDHFQQVAHSLSALLAGMLGGLYSAWLFARRERGEGPSIDRIAPPNDRKPPVV